MMQRWDDGMMGLLFIFFFFFFFFFFSVVESRLEDS